MSKIIVPKHVEWGMFDMWVDIGPFRVKMWQLFIIALWTGIFLSIVNWLKKWWLGTVAAWIIASPVMILTFVIAFFRKSELYIIPFLTKLIRTYVINSPRTFQRNIDKPSEVDIKIHFARLNKWEEKVTEQKEFKKDEISELEVLNKF